MNGDADEHDTPAEVDATVRTLRRVAVGYFVVFLVATPLCLELAKVLKRKPREIAEIMAKAGFDWLVVDMEHTAIDAWDCFQLIQIIELAGSVPLVRVGANDELLIKRALDAAAGS